MWIAVIKLGSYSSLIVVEVQTCILEAAQAVAVQMAIGPAALLILHGEVWSGQIAADAEIRLGGIGSAGNVEIRQVGGLSGGG